MPSTSRQRQRHTVDASSQEAHTDPRPRVAVVGSGLAGLTAAYLLAREGADVWLIDKARRLGFHAWSVELGGEDDDSKLHLTNGYSSTSKSPDFFAVDVPMRSFQGGYYPQLIALYKHLGLTLQPARYTFSFSSLPPREVPGRRPRRQDTYLTYGGASGTSIPIVPSRSWASPTALARAILSLLSAGICFVVLIVTAAVSWHGFLSQTRTFRDIVDTVASALDNPLPFVHTPFGAAFRSFATEILVPLFSSVGTMTSQDLWATPAHNVLDYIHAGMGTSHYSLGRGQSARDVARLLSEPVRKQGEDHVKLGTDISSIKYNADDSTLRLTFGDGSDLAVDKLVLATPATVARSLVKDLEKSLASAGGAAGPESKRVRKVISALGDIEYRNTIVVTHRDYNVLPLADVKDINLVVPPEISAVDSDTDSNASTPSAVSTVSSAPSSPCPTPTTSLTGVMPYFEPTATETYTMATHLVRAPDDLILQTTNPVVPIAADKVLGMARLERALPLTDMRTFDALHAEGEGRKVYIAGSYAYPGIPLLEGCVGSARRATDDILREMRGGGQQTESDAGGWSTEQRRLKNMTGGVDWAAGRGSLVGRLWRWRRGSAY